MAHRLATPARSDRNTIWLESVVTGAPVVKLHESSLASRTPSAPRSLGARWTSYVVFGRRGPDGWKRRMRGPYSASPAAPGAATASSDPGTAGVMVRRLLETLLGSSGLSMVTAIGVVPPTP